MFAPLRECLRSRKPRSIPRSSGRKPARMSFEPLEDRTVPSGADFSLDFVASAPFTYDHATGGGAYDDRTIGKSNDVVESLEGGDFTCGDIVSYLVAIKVDAAPDAANQTIDLDFSFLADTTGQSGVGLVDIVGTKINYGVIPNGAGDGPGGTDSGMLDDGGSTATLTSESLTAPPFTQGANLLGTVRVSDLEAGEQVILRIDVRIDCDPNSHPTGNLQAAIVAARVVTPAADTIHVGNQTIPFKSAGEINRPPVANPDSFQCVDVDESFVMTVASLLANDTDADGNPLAITAVSPTSAQGGSVVLNGDGTITYTPSTSFFGVDTFTYTVSDGQGGSATGTVTLELNHTPVANNDDLGLIALSASKTTPVVYSDVDGDSLTVSITTAPTKGTVLDNHDGTFTYTANPGASGTDSFNYSVYDGCETVYGAVTVFIADPGIHLVKLTNGTDNNNPTGPILQVGDTVTWTYLVTNTGNIALGSLSVTDDQGVTPVYQSGDDDHDGLLDLTETWTYSASGIALPGQYANVGTAKGTDAAGQTVSATDPDHYYGNSPPHSGGPLVLNCVEVEEPLKISVADLLAGYTDPDGDPLTVTATAAMSILGAPVALNDNGTPGDPSDDYVLYTPNAGLFGTDGFKYTVSDGQGGSATGTVTLDLNHTPVANNDDLGLIALGASKTTPVVYSDVDGDSLTVSITTAPTKGTVLDNHDGTFTYTANPGASGTDSFNYSVYDGCETVYGAVTVFIADPGIHLVKLTNGTDNNNPTGPILQVGDTVTWTYLVTNTGNIALGSLSVTDDQGATPVYQSGDDDHDGLLDLTETWTYSASGIALPGQYANVGTAKGTDAAGQTVSATDPDHYYGNSPPHSGGPLVLNCVEVEEPLKISVADLLAGYTDPDGDSLTVTATAATSTLGAPVALNDNGTPGDPSDDYIVYTPNAGLFGTDGFKYTVSDGQGGSATGTVTLGLNHTPVANNDTLPGTVTVGSSTTISVASLLANDTDADGDPLAITAVSPTSAQGGSVVLNGNGTITYTPAAGSSGTDTFTYYVSDGCETVAATVTVHLLRLGGGGGHTLGFWSNKNGQAIMNDDGGVASELALLSSLNLRNANGTNFDPSSYTSFRTWLLGATATNMACMLSAQLAAMELNVEASSNHSGFVNSSSLVYAGDLLALFPGGNSSIGLHADGSISIADLMAAANTELGLHGVVLSGSPFRAYQEALKNALDLANNNLNFII